MVTIIGGGENVELTRGAVISAGMLSGALGKETTLFVPAAAPAQRVKSASFILMYVIWMMKVR